MEDIKSSTSSVAEHNNGQNHKQQQEKLNPLEKQVNAPSASRRWLDHVLGDIYAEDSPQDLSKGKKNAIILVVALGGVFGPLASMIYMPSLVNIAQALNTSTASVNATISTFVVFMGIGPLFWASFSDLYGRKPMYLISIIIFIIASVLCGISTNVEMLAIFRAIQAIGASAGQSVGAGVISDVFIPAERGTAYGFFYVGPLCGPVIGPLLGGILGEFLGWRSNFYFLAIVGGILFAMVLFFLPETLRKKHDDNWDEATLPKKRSMMDNIRHVSAAFKPMIGLLSYPNVMVITMYNTVIFGALYFMNPTITQTFTQLYNYNDLIIGLCYLPFGLGLMVGSIGSGRWSDWLLARKKRLTNGPVPHEYRLIATFPSVILIPLGYLGYGWSTQKGTSVWLPLVSLFVYGVGQMTAFNSSSVYLVDCSPGRSASAIAVNNFFRTLVAAIVTAFSIQCIEAIGTGPLFSILAGINVLNILNVLIVRRYGERWRNAAMKREGLEVEDTIITKPDEEEPVYLDVKTDEVRGNIKAWQSGIENVYILVIEIFRDSRFFYLFALCYCADLAMSHSASNGSSSKSEKAAVYEKPSKKSLLSISRKRKVGSSEDEVYNKRPALKTSNGATAPAEGQSTEHIAKELEKASISNDRMKYHCDRGCAHGEGSSKKHNLQWPFMMKDKPQEKKQESKARGDSDDEFWKQAAEMYADEDALLEDDTREEAEPETPTFDDLPSPVVQALVEHMEEDNDTPTIPESNEVSDKDTDTELVIAQNESGIDYPKESESSEKSAVVRKKVPGENTFSHDCVKTWSPARIHAWEIRRLNPEAFYYRFVDPAQGQNNGSFTKVDHENFMKRMEVWKEKGYRVGASWGIFSMGIPHRAGYQCSAYYRKLIQSKKIQDDAYAMVDGKLKMVDKSRTNAGEVATSELSEAWQTDEVRDIEKQVEQWLREYHNRSGSIVVKKPAAPKPKAAPRVYKSTAAKSGDIAALVKQNIGVGDFRLLTDEEAFMLAAEPSAIKVRRRNWDEIWQASLKEYRQFVEGFQDPEIRRKYHEEKRKWRKGLTTTEYASAMKRTSQAPNIASSSTIINTNAVKKATQLSLASFFSGVKKVKPKADTPDEFISRCVIPNELFSGVKHMRGLYNEKRIDAPDAKTKYWELNDMNDCISILDETVQTISDKAFHNAIEGVLIDPPWDFYVADGRNDGRCKWSLTKMMTFLDDVLKHMSAGLIFMWTHKSTQADVVRMMYSLGCKYVENLVWFKKTLSNVLQDRPSPYFSSSKEILLIFKKGDGFELRHQRTADVIIDFERPTDQWIHEEYTELKPPGVYDMIETLLPKAGYDEALGRGRLLELWAKRQTPRREGWLAFHNIKPAKDAEVVELPAEGTSNVSSMIVDSVHSEESSADQVK